MNRLNLSTVRAQLAARLRWLIGAGIVLTVALAWFLWPSSTTEQPRERRYRDFTACLLTDNRELAGPDVAPVWRGLQDASVATRVRVQHLAIMGPQTVGNAESFVNSLTRSRCAVIVAAGKLPVAAVVKAAPRFTDQRFVAVGAAESHGNVIAVTTSDQSAIQASVAQIVANAVTALPDDR